MEVVIKDLGDEILKIDIKMIKPHMNGQHDYSVCVHHQNQVGTFTVTTDKTHEALAYAALQRFMFPS